MLPWLVSQGGYACGCMARQRGAREVARVQRALGACAVAHVVTHSFSARGEIARRSPLAERGDRHTPTQRVDMHPPQEGPTCTYAPHAPLPPTFLGRRATKDPEAPPLGAVCVSPSPWQPPGSGAAKSKKNSRATRQDGKLHGASCSKIHASNLSTWRVPCGLKYRVTSLRKASDTVGPNDATGNNLTTPTRRSSRRPPSTPRPRPKMPQQTRI